nr:MAG TPA: hypothetical protein [Bacteriophage sp.]
MLVQEFYLLHLVLVYFLPFPISSINSNRLQTDCKQPILLI